MEGKFELQFEDNEYYLVDGNTNDTVATTDKVLLKEYDGYMKKLSLKNCDAIANGYDLIKLIEENSKYSEEDWGDGFLFAMNLMSDKKFSEEDMRKAYQKGEEDSYTQGGLTKQKEDNYIQSIQQTEWDVEIEMECGEVRQCECSSNENCMNPKPKLDKDGCLILKRK